MTDTNRSGRSLNRCALTLGIPFTTFVCGDVVNGGPAPWFDRLSLVVRRIGVARAATFWPTAAGLASKERNLLWTLKEIPLEEVLRGLERAEEGAEQETEALRSRYMDVADLRAIARNELVAIGSHTHRHPILSRLTREQQRSEIECGIAALRPIVSKVNLFAYPNGKPQDYDDHVISQLREHGIVAAVTTVQRCLSARDDVMQLPRLGVSEGRRLGVLSSNGLCRGQVLGMHERGFIVGACRPELHALETMLDCRLWLSNGDSARV